MRLVSFLIGGITALVLMSCSKPEDKYLHLEEGYSESACTTECLKNGQEIRERTYLGECYCQLKEGPK